MQGEGMHDRLAVCRRDTSRSEGPLWDLGILPATEPDQMISVYRQSSYVRVSIDAVEVGESTEVLLRS
jgi:hypothetical protein